MLYLFVGIRTATWATCPYVWSHGTGARTLPPEIRIETRITYRGGLVLKSQLSRTLTAVACAALLLFAPGCDDSDDDDSGTPGSGGSSTLVTKDSNPPEGDASYTNPSIFYDINADGSGYDRVVVSETVGATGHEITLYFTPGTGAVHSVQHFWGPVAGGASSNTQCLEGSNTCDPAKVVVDEGAQTVTFSDLVLDGLLDPSQTSTIDGAVQWP